MDQLFLHVASVANVYELLAAQIALEKAADPAVREFARMLVEHHSDSHAQLKRMAAQRSVALTTDTPLGKLQTIRQLATTQGAAFDLLFVQAVQNQDYTLTQALVMLTVTVFVLSNLIVDLMYAWLDPRIRYS